MQIGSQQTILRRLFTKNLAPCQPIWGCIRGDACPVPEGHEDGWYCVSLSFDTKYKTESIKYKTIWFLILSFIFLTWVASGSETRLSLEFKPRWTAAVTMEMSELPANECTPSVACTVRRGHSPLHSKCEVG